MARLAGFISNRPDLCNRFASAERATLSVRNTQADPWGWGVGFYQTGDVLLKRRPLDERAELAVADMIADVRADLLVTHVRRATVGALRTANTHPFRYRHWMFAQTGTLGGGEMHHRIHESLPPFLQRSVSGDTDGERLFYSYLSFLHDAGRLDSLLVPYEEAAAALREALHLVDHLGADSEADRSRLNLLVACPEYLIAVHRNRTMAYRVLRGRQDFEPLYDVDGPGKLLMPDLEPCRLAVVASDFDDGAPLDGWTVVEPETMVVFSRTDDPVVVRGL